MDQGKVTTLVVIMVSAVILGALMPTIANSFAITTISQVIPASSLPVDQKATMTNNQANNSGFIAKFITSQIGGQNVVAATLCFTPSQTIQAGTWVNVSSIANQTWRSDISAAAYNTTLMARTNYLNTSLYASGSQYCFNVTNQIKASQALTYGSIEVLNANHTFDYTKMTNYTGYTQDVWIANTTDEASTSVNITKASGLQLTVTTSQPLGAATIALLGVFVVIFLLVIMLRFLGKL